GGAGLRIDARAVDVFVEDRDRHGKVESGCQSAGIFQRAEGGEPYHFAFFIAYGASAAAMIDIGVHLDHGPVSDGLLDRADDAGGQSGFDGRSCGHKIIVRNGPRVAIDVQLLADLRQRGGCQLQYRQRIAILYLENSDIFTWHRLAPDDDVRHSFDSIGLLYAVIDPVDHVDVLFKIVQDHGEQTGIDGSVSSVQQAALLFVEMGGPGVFEGRDAGLGNLPESGEDELAPDEG